MAAASGRRAPDVAEDARSLSARRAAIPRFSRQAPRRSAVAERAGRIVTRGCAGVFGGAARRRYRQPLADAQPRRAARLRPLSGEERQGQGRGARRGARAKDRQDLAAAAGGGRRQKHGRSGYRGRRRPRTVDSCPRRRGARLALRLRLAHLRSARTKARRFRRARRAHGHGKRPQGAHGAADRAR